ncbi:MAG: hypothetical protein ABEI53_00675 [Candidatus Magasanikbacteria bacterium]
MSLIQFAKSNKLPEHQYLDEETMSWIQENKPNFNSPKFKIDPEVINKIKKFIPSKEWFLKPSHIDTIHGIRHIIRVIIHSYILSNRQQFNKNRRFE